MSTVTHPAPRPRRKPWWVAVLGCALTVGAPVAAGTTSPQSAELFTTEQVGLVLSSLDFSERLLDACSHVNSHCGWIQVVGSDWDLDPYDLSAGARETTSGFAAGIQRRLTHDVVWSFAAQYESTDLNSTGDIFESDGDRFQIGLQITRVIDRNIYSAMVGVGEGGYASTRHIGPPSAGMAAFSDQDAEVLTGHFRWAYDIRHGDHWSIQSMFDLGTNIVSIGGFTETGAGAENLTVFDHGETFVSAQAGAIFARDFAIGGDGTLRFHSRLGATWLSEDQLEITSMVGSPNAPQVSVYGRMDDLVGDVELCLDVLPRNSGASLEFSYRGQLGGHLTVHRASVMVGVPF